MMTYVIPIIAWFVMLFVPMDRMIELGVDSDCLVNAYCYQVAHTSWLHLGINTLSLFILWIPVRRLYILKYNTDTLLLNFNTYIASLIAGLACAGHLPTVGMSGMVFFLLGVLLLLNPTKRQALNYIWILAALILQAYFGHSNVALHVFAFVEGALYVCLREFLYQYTHNTGLFDTHADA